jgi:Tfp pilus assembly protein PilO
LELVYTAVPQKPNATLCAKKLEFLNSKHSLQLKVLEFEKATLFESQKKKNNLKEKSIEFTLETSGEYPNIKNFLKDLLMLDRMVIIKNITLQKTTEKSANNSVSLQLKGVILYLDKNYEEKK